MIRAAAFVVASFTAMLSAQDRVAGHLLLFNDNGAWSWFQDERAIVDRVHQLLLVGSCADSSGFGGSARGGDIDVAWLDLDAGTIRSFELHNRLEGDDHDSPALLARADGRLLAMYGRHGSDRLARWRVTVNPGDPSQWTPERTLNNAAGLTYSNLHYLTEANGLAGITYDFTRTVNYDPNVLVSHDLGDSWSYGGKLLTEGGGSDRPYLEYVSDGRLRVHLLATERHPRNYDNSIYHGYVEDRALYDSTGRLVDPDVLDSSGRPPSQLTRVFATGSLFNGVPLRRAWTIDIALDRNGMPRALMQARARDLDTDHRLLFASFDGTAWSIFQVCRLGAGLYSPENDYTGLAALHPDDPTRIYVSTPIDPRNGAGLAHHEIFRGDTADGGRTWSFLPVTQDSTVDNLRPIVPAWGEGRTALLWLRGTYSTYTNYDLAVVGSIDAPELRFDASNYVDATRSNTVGIGAVFNPTGPSSAQGATDGRWHERTGWGNGGSVLTSDEQGSEDAPLLRTSASGLAPGRYDTFLFFWSNPGNAWLIRGGLQASALRTFEKQGSETVEVADTTAPIVLTGSTVVLYKAWLGRADVGASGRLDVFVDDLPTGQSPGTRTWFDGIGYAPVTDTASTLEVGVPCGTGAAALDVAGAPVLGSSMSLTIVGGQPGALAGLVLGGGLAPLELRGFGFPSCTLYAIPSGSILLGALSAAGQSLPQTIPVPNDPALLRARAGFQGAVFVGSGQLQLTAGQLATVGR